MPASELAARLQQDVIAAMKAKDKARLGVLRMLQAAVKQVEVDTRAELDDDAVVKVLQSYRKKVRDSLAGARESGRDELVAQAEAELVVVESYLPAELDDAALEALVREVIAETGAESMKDMGRVMKAVLAKAAGRVDGSRVSPVVKTLLAG